MNLTFTEEGHQYHLDGKPIPSVTTILSDVGLYPSFDGVPGREWYAQRGTAVHLACHYLDNDELDEATLDERILPYVQAYKLFKENWRVEGIESEKMVGDPRYWYAGTVDKLLVCTPPGQERVEHILFDIKCGQPAKGYKYQTAAYAYANGTPEIRRAGLYLNDLGDYRVDFHDDRDDLHIFICAVNVYHAKNGGAK